MNNYIRVSRKSGLTLLFTFFFVMSLLLFCFSRVSASDNAESEVSASEKQEIMERIFSLQKNIRSISASITQEKHLSALKKTLRLEGSVEMAKPNLLRWQVTRPDKSLTVVDGETMTVYYPDTKEAQVFALSENIGVRNTVGFLAAAMSGAFSKMERRFSIAVFRSPGEIVFKLRPLSNIVSKYISVIVIRYREATGLPKSIEMSTPKGDSTLTVLRDVQINPDIGPDAFKIKLPDSVRITNREERNATR